MHDIASRLWRHPRGRVGIIITAAIIVVAIAAPWIAPYDPYDIGQRGPRRMPPGLGHPLGTDAQGKDILSKLIYGARVSLIVGITTGVCVTVLGALLGILAGYLGGFADTLIMRICDILFVVPGLPLMILLANYMGTKFYMIIVIFTMLGWAGVARMIRSQVLSLKSRDFVVASRSVGARPGHIMREHILVSVSPLLIVNGVLSAAGVMVAEAGLSFLGFGDPTAVSWGKMLYEAQSGHALLFGAWWWVIPPGLAIFITVFGFMMFGYALEEVLNPHIPRQSAYSKLRKGMARYAGIGKQAGIGRPGGGESVG